MESGFALTTPCTAPVLQYLQEWAETVDGWQRCDVKMASDHYNLSSKEFSLERVIAEGSFGIVRMCRRRANNELLAAKIPKNSMCTPIEILCMEALMNLKLDQRNIVKYFGTFSLFHQRVMVFEWLDMNLDQYLVRASPLHLSEIRSIIQQVATALDALASISLIHGDLHPSNIMVTKRLPEPIKVKVIDFGTAFSTSKADPVMSLQIISFRAPELFLGLPFTEAIDLWSLAVVLCFIISESLPFPGKTHYEVLTSMINILGQPPDCLLDHGFKTKRYFIKTPYNTWRLKTPWEFFHENVPTTDATVFSSLDELKELSVKMRYQVNPSEWDQCIELIKAMFQIPVSERITASEVLAHPFITPVPPNAIPVQPAPPENTFLLDYEENLEGLQTPTDLKLGHPFCLTRNISWPAADTLRDHETMFFKPDNPSPFPTFQPRTIEVQPAKHENAPQLQDLEGLQTHVDLTPKCPLSFETGVCWPVTPALKEDRTPLVQQDDNSPPPTIQPRVIVVQPTKHDNTLQLEDLDGAECLLSRLQWSSESKSDLDSCRANRIEKKPRRRKKRIRGFCFWMKQTFFSCTTAKVKDPG